MENLQRLQYPPTVSWNLIPRVWPSLNWSTSTVLSKSSKMQAGVLGLFILLLSVNGGPFHPLFWQILFGMVLKPLLLSGFQLTASADSVKFWLC